MPTRRAFTLALSLAPLAVTTAAAPAPDPVFAAIEAHRAARTLVHAMGVTDYDEGAFDALVEAECSRLAELLALTPTTPTGCAVMLRYVGEDAIRLQEDGCDSQLFAGWCEPISEPAATLLGRLAAVIEHQAARAAAATASSARP